MAVYFRGYGFGQTIKQLLFGLLRAQLIDFGHIILSDLHVHILFLLALDLEGLDAGVEDQILLMHVPFLPLGQKDTLDLDYIAWLCLLDIGASQD